MFELIDAHLDLTGEASSSRDGYFGRVFALASLLKSKRLVDEPALFQRVTKDLCSYMQKKIYLRECCCSLLCGMVQEVSTDVIKAHVAPALVEVFNEATLSAESLAIAFSLAKHTLDIRTLFPTAFDGDSIFSKSFAEMFSEEHISALVEPLQQTSANLPSVHPVWTGLWALLAREKNICMVYFFPLWSFRNYPWQSMNSFSPFPAKGCPSGIVVLALPHPCADRRWTG